MYKRQGVQRELRDHEHFAAHVCQCEVRLAFGVLEDAQARYLGPEAFGFGFRVVVPHAQQDDESASNGPDRQAVDVHLRTAHALHDGPHLSLIHI